MTLTEFYGLTIINFILLRAFFDEQGPSSSLEDTTAISKSSSLPTRWKRFVELIEGWSDFGFFECRAVPAFLLFLPSSGVKKTSCHPAEGWGSATELTRELLWLYIYSVTYSYSFFTYSRKNYRVGNPTQCTQFTCECQVVVSTHDFTEIQINGTHLITTSPNQWHPIFETA